MSPVIPLPSRARSLLRRGGNLLHRLAAGGPPVSPPGANRLYYSTWSWVALANGEGGEYVEVDPCHPIYRRPPETGTPGVHWKFLSEFHRVSPATFVASVPEGRVWGRCGAVLTASGHLLADVSVELGGAPEHHSVFRGEPGEPRREDGAVVVLTAAGGETYFHWLFDVLPRLDLLRRSGVPLDGAERYLVNSLRMPFQRESLERLGIPPSRVLESEKVPDLRAGRLVVPSLPGMSGNPTRRACEFLRTAFLQGREDGRDARPRRVYVSRARARGRRIVNEGEVLAVLGRFGFETVELESLSFAQQVELFASADQVVAPHGAGLSNLVFCGPRTKVLELFSPSYVNVCYWALSDLVGAEYRYLLGEGEPPPDFVDPHLVGEDLRVDPEKLAGALAEMGARP